MLERLNNRWTAIENASLSGEDAEEQEVLENTSLRLLSKDYIDLIHKLLETKSHNGTFQGAANGSEGTGDTLMGETEDSNHASPAQATTSMEEPGECGLLLLADSTCFQAIIHLCIK